MTPSLPSAAFTLLGGQSLSLHLNLTASARLAAPKEPGILPSHHPSAGVAGTHHYALYFMWVLAMRTQVLMLVRWVLYLLSHSRSTNLISDNAIHPKT